MRNFLRIATGINPNPLLLELAAQPGLWNAFPVRTCHTQSNHRVVDDVVLRYSKFAPGDDYMDKVCSSIDVVDYPAWMALPSARQFVFALMTQVQGVHLGRVMVTRLAPGVSIPLHSDRIEPAEAAFPNRIPPAVYYERFHIVLQSEPGVAFACGNEVAWMAPGEAWWFNNQIEHSVMNNSGNDRIHLILDVRTAHDDYIPS
jgi:hypothetical protein